MSSIKQLLQGAEVEWKPLEKVAEIGTGNSNRKDEVENGEYPFYVRSKNVLRSSTYQFDEVAIIIPGEGGIGDIFHYANGKYALHQRAYRVHIVDKKVSTKFLYYFMQGYFKDYIISKSVGATASSIRKPMLEKFPIPIPPLSVQEEIVEILDKFSTLTAELQAELQARKSQYDYYREQLLSSIEENDHSSQPQSELDLHTNNSVWQPQGKVEWKALGEIGKFTRGLGIQKKDFTETGVGCIHYGQIHTHYGSHTNETTTFVSQKTAKNSRKAKYGDLIIATTSEDDKDVCKAVAWLGEEEIAVSSDACFYTHNLHPKYVTYFFQTEQFDKQKRPFITGAKVRRVHPDNLAKIKIPIPSPEEQERIVNILDKFETLIRSISEGLPKEIELRQKQYEYYRDKLLAFGSIKNKNE